MQDQDKTLFIVRCARFDAPARMLADRLAGTGETVVLATSGEDDPAGAGAFGTVPMTETGLEALGFAPLPDNWRWLFGDLCYVMAAEAYPGFARYALIESDVHLPAVSAAPLVAALAAHPADAIAAELGPSPRRKRFSHALRRFGLDASWGCLFPLTRVTPALIDAMADLRREEIAAPARRRMNDEAILAGAVLRGGFSHARLEDILPDRVGPGWFQTNPPHAWEALEAAPDDPLIRHPALPYAVIEDRIRSGERNYSRRRLRRVLAAAPPDRRAGLEALLDSAERLRGDSPGAVIRRLAGAVALNRPIRVLDIGANPLIEGKVSYRALLDAGQAEVTGFEPQARALSALNARKSDAESYLPHALGDGGGGMLHLTRSEGFTSLYSPDPSSTALLGFGGGTDVLNRAEVETRRLDDLADVPRPDFLKIDVQGAETDILRAGRDTLSGTLAIQTELRMFPIYDGEPDRAELEAELVRQGFRFLRYLSVKHVCLSGRRRRLRRGDFAQAVDGDAFFVRDLRGIDGWPDGDIARLAVLAHAVMDCPDLCVFAMDKLAARGRIDPAAADAYLSDLPKGRLKG